MHIIIASDDDHGKALRRTGRWGKSAAGAIVLARNTGRLMLVHRSIAVLEPHMWGTAGGAQDRGETPEYTAEREMHEELGYQGDIELKALAVFHEQRSGFKYHNFLAIVPKEFVPRLNWENDAYTWFTFGKWPAPLHPGVSYLLRESARDIKTIIDGL